MKKVAVLFLAFTVGVVSFSKADEGMWLPLLIKRLNFKDMKKMGLKLSPEEIYSVNESSLKDAIVQLNGGSCTAEIISPNGLMLTNHHCGYPAISDNSTPDNDILEKGFWAGSMKEEIVVPDYTASILYRMEDVTKKVLGDIKKDSTESYRSEVIREKIRKIETEASEDGKYKAEVKPFFYGNEYYVFVYKVYKDVRLVGAPPESIGKFGGDTDNWMWPRHTGDFSMFRIYADENNEPAEYSDSNQPLEPKHYLPISIDGVDEGDFSMIMGYPGTTKRYMTSYEVKHQVQKVQPLRVELRRQKLDIMDKYMKKNKETQLHYASKYAQVSNYWKYFKGQSKQLKANNVYEKKKNLEDEFQKWADKKKKRKEQYGDVLKNIEEAKNTLHKNYLSGVYINEAVIGSSLNFFLYQNRRPLLTLTDTASSEEDIKKAVATLKKSAQEHFKKYNYDLEREIYGAMLEKYMRDIPRAKRAETLNELDDSLDIKWQTFTNQAFQESVLTKKERFMEFLENPEAKRLENDLLADIFQEQLGAYRKVAFQNVSANTDLKVAMRYFIAGLRKMQKKKDFYPNANSTLRVSYGEVDDYEVGDTVSYNFTTNLAGVMKKEDPDSDEFQVPPKLKELYEAKEYGRWGEDGHLIVNFISGNDITGGNSGSPVINGKGELIGCAFDGNWEAMSGDIFFEEKIQRTINVDIRYVLFIIDKYAGADHLIEEMKILN